MANVKKIYLYRDKETEIHQIFILDDGFAITLLLFN